MKKLLIAVMLSLYVVIGSNSLPLFAVDFGDLLYTLYNPNDYGTPEYDYYGYSVDIYGEYAVVGSYLEDELGGTNSGRAYVYNVSDGSLLYTLYNPNIYGTNTDQFGYAVTINETYVFVGSLKEDELGGNDSGVVYIFNLSDGTLAHTLYNPNAFGTIASDQFGEVLSSDNNYLIVGTRFEDDSGGSSSGVAYIFDLTDFSLTYTLYNPNNFLGSAGDQFGASVGINGNYIIVGANGEDRGGNGSGIAYVYDLSNGNLLYTFNNPTVYGTGDFDGFGTSVSTDGIYAIVSAYGEDIDKDGIYASSSGVAYVYDLIDGSLLYNLYNPNAYLSSTTDTFGFSVSLFGDYIIVGAYQEDDITGNSSGVAYIFDTITGNLLNTLYNPNTYSTGTNDYFGRVVKTDGYNFIISAHGERHPYPPPNEIWIYESSGIAYIFQGIGMPISYTITFNSNGGSAVDPITQVSGTDVTQPSDPTLEGYTFGGWYSDFTLINEYTFSTMTEDITLYAKWNEIVIPSGDGVTNNFGFIFISILLYFALLFLRFKTGQRIYGVFDIGILIFLIIEFSGSIPMIIVLTGFIIYHLYDTVLGGKT